MITLDQDRKALTDGRAYLNLTAGQFAIVELLIKRPGVIRTRNEILDHIFGDAEGDILDRNVDSQIKRVRRMIRDTFKKTDVIETRYGFGYAWADPPAPPR